jgi:hypothetical protein
MTGPQGIPGTATNTGAQGPTGSFVYEAQTGTINWVGPVSIPGVSYRLEKIQDTVTFTSGSLSQNAASVSTTFSPSGFTLPAIYRPNVQPYFAMVVVNNSTFQLGVLTVFTNGQLTIYADGGLDNFTNSGNAGTAPFSATWLTL